ncbi:serine threonine protein kinase : Putative serine/threonine protein kinase (Fragment) OS=Gemmata sp. Wa1-1 PE=3 SV=1: Pkinase [Gemmata massiliana]|uniref:Protein kinase domain-containing protein n=1 Tax=Gemmata massiliana TaxID=1210884 RepID=A0A6P2CUQ5_9BACT
MPAPTTADEILDLVQKSGLVDEVRLRNYVQKLRESDSLPADPTKIAQILVRDAVLTYFQAEQLLQGKYKRFSLGKYKVLEKLGSGGMGTVFLCEHKLMRRRVAVKVLPISKGSDKASLDRFYREARAIAAVDHPNIVRAYDIDQDENLHFLVMEWVDGVNLQDLVKKFGPLDPTRACHYAYGAAIGLQHAHEMGLIHRDIKPGNVLVDRFGVVKVLDLGLARLTHDTEDNLTRQNDENVLGTADYLAPEQAMDSHTVDIRADIYSLGATMYFLLSGSPPFPEGSVAQKLIWHQNRTPRPLRLLRSDAPDELVAVVERMMAKDPARRYQTPAEVMAALAGWVTAPIPPPADREMPTLSPAVANAAGGRGTGVSPALTSSTSTGGFNRPPLTPSPPTFTTAATVITGSTPRPAPAQNRPEPAVWANLEQETQDRARSDTEKPEPIELPIPDEEERPSRVNRKKPAGANTGKVVLLACISALVFVAVVAAVYFAFFNRSTQPTTPTTGPGTGPKRITVSKAGGENAVGSLREALQKAGPGDTIVIAEPKLVEPALRLDSKKHKDLTIESAIESRPAVIEFASKGGTMFDASNIEGCRLRNLEFDGKGQAEIGLQVNGTSPGTTVENVTLRNVLKTGIHLWHVTGAPGRPVTLDRVRIVLASDSEAGVMLYATAVDNKFLTIKNGRFEGPGRAGIRIDGPVLDFEVTNNRFYNLVGAGVVFVRPLGRPSRGTFANNTFYQMPIGFLFECPAAESGVYDLKVSLSYFARIPELLRAHGPVAKLEAPNNFYDSNSGPGNPPLPSTKLDAPKLPDPNPNDDAAFLRFHTNPPMAGASRVGAH